jgi:hypothetical protein
MVVDYGWAKAVDGLKSIRYHYFFVKASKTFPK